MTAHHRPRTRRLGGATLLLAVLLALATSGRAQQPILPPVAPAPAAAEPAQATGGEAILGNPIVTPPDDLGPFYQNGSLVLRPHLLYRVLYGDGLQATPGHASSTFINTFAPGLFVGLGSNWIVDYTPSWDVYSNHAFEDTVDQTLNISGKEAYESWSLQFSTSYLRSTEPLVETGMQTSEQDFPTSLAIAHVLTNQFAIEADLGQYLRFAQGFPDSRNWSDTNWLNYQINPALIAGIGIGLGYVEDSGQPDSTYTNPEVRLTWTPGKKLSISGDLGTEHREFYGHPKTGLTSPTFDLSADYRILDGTRLRASVGRTVSDSYFVGETAKNFFWNLSLEQRLATHWILSGGFGHDETHYVATTTALLTQAREDNQTSYNVRLSWEVTHRATLALFFNSSRDDSTGEFYTFDSNQAGLEANYKF